MLRTSRRDRRRGNILIVTLALLALMAIVGLTAVYYTRDQAERARIQGQPKGGGEGFSADGTAPATHFLRVLLYDDNDYGTALLNSVRGHSLTATMYGRKPGANIAWNGPGTFGGGSLTYNGVDRRQAVNHQLFPTNTAAIIDPEYDTARAPGTTPPTYAGTYYGKNPPYTYPDNKDFYLASLCPATGEVLVPSFHRLNATAGFGPLDPSNPNWTNGTGKFLTLRPRPADHANKFPPVPANQDGSYTGDVQNLPGGFFLNQSDPQKPAIARNDSIWIDTGLPAFTLPNGKRVKPLIAPLVLDLDGRLNLNVHGNTMSASKSHQSGQGFGPWEVSLEKALPTTVTEVQAVVAARGVMATRSSLTTRAAFPRLATGNELPKYAQVAWTGFSSAPTLTLPAAAATDPTYSPTSGYLSTNTPIPNHPSLYNPYEWGATGATKAFPFNDTKLLSFRYSPYRYDISQLTFATSATTSLTGTAALPTPNPPGRLDPNPYRTDAAHANRMLFTTASNSLQRSMLMPGYTGTTPQSSDPAASTVAAGGLYLGGIDLNRPLADYRGTNTGAPLSPSPTSVTATTAATADLERQQFAMDIFVRLVAASADPTNEAKIDPTTGLVTLVGMGATPGSTEFNNVRNLAQLAANIVDYIDNDDINTSFVWNPQNPADVRNAANFTSAEVKNRVVFGVEKPRLVLNEAYAEVCNDKNDPMITGQPTDKASTHYVVRFFVELQNPTHTGSTSTAIGSGGAVVKHTGGFNPYRLTVVNNTGAPLPVNGLRVTTDADYPGNVAGAPPTSATEVIAFDFTKATATTSTINPADGMAGAGIVVCVPDSGEVKAGLPFAASPANQIVGDVSGAVGTTSPTAMSYRVAVTTTPASLGRHLVLLRRLANPYITGPTDTNPYITVDVMDHVRTADRRECDQNMKRMAQTAMNPMGYEPYAAGEEALWPASVGKMQPYASYSDPALTDSKNATNTGTSPNTMVVQQTTTSGGVKHTFGQQNNTVTNPFDWHVHLDRPLVNQTELLHVTIGKQHDLTTNFVTGTTKHTATLFHHAFVATPATYQKFYRAADLLAVQPFGHQTALGGRVPGRININTIQDKRVWDALFDAQNNGFDQTFVTNLWNQLMATRTTTIADRYAVGNPTAFKCPVPGATVHDTGATGSDRPFLPFGVATVPASSGATFNAGVGFDDTLLRRVPAGTGLPSIFVPTTTAPHPYQQAEALRKILNNTTTVSHTFAVWITVGYFEVEAETTPPGWPAGLAPAVTLGKEYYINAPGDTRKKFFALVDRSNIGYKPEELLAPPAAGTPYTQIDYPFFTTIEGTAAIPASPDAMPPGPVTIPISTSGGAVVYSDGVPVTLAAGMQVVIGVGANQEVVTVSAPSATGFTATTTKRHYPGEVVSNIVPGNPGVPTDFDPTIAKYKAVVPLWVKLP